MQNLLIFIVWVIFTTILTAALVLRSRWKLYNPGWAEKAADMHVEEKRIRRDRRKKFGAWPHPERRKKYRSKL